jgi:predicted TIM-barrel fold metal-dependent hydrolase
VNRPVDYVGAAVRSARTSEESRIVRAVPAFLLLFLCAACTAPQTPAPLPAIDPELAREIAAVKAIDNHAHPVRPVRPGEAPDREFDALPVDDLVAQADPERQRPTSKTVTRVAAELYGGDRAAARTAHAAEWATWVLDRAGIDVMFANRVAMGEGLPSSRFVWVPFADALMFPLDNAGLADTPDMKAFFPLEEKLLARYYAESGVKARPATLDDYLHKVVRATLERHKQGGAVAEKYELAYLRSLAIGNPTKAEAEAAWNGRGSYTALQDYIFRFIAQECGRLGMAVHIHVAHGGGSFFKVEWANPLLLDPLLNDPSLRTTTFVLIHGGWPYTAESVPLLTKPNAYVDFSEQTAFTSPHSVAGVLRAWLEYNPEKVLFATDAYGFSDALGWEEATYINAKAGREALGRALTGMLRDDEVTLERAKQLAHMVLRDNARALYGLK